MRGGAGGSRRKQPLLEQFGEKQSPQGRTGQLQLTDAGTFRGKGEGRGDFATRGQKALGKCWGLGGCVL